MIRRCSGTVLRTERGAAGDNIILYTRRRRQSCAERYRYNIVIVRERKYVQRYYRLRSRRRSVEPWYSSCCCCCGVGRGHTASARARANRGSPLQFVFATASATHAGPSCSRALQQNRVRSARDAMPTSMTASHGGVLYYVVKVPKDEPTAADYVSATASHKYLEEKRTLSPLNLE